MSDKVDKTISFIIVNFNMADEIEKCINSIYKTNNDVSFEIIVVDNNSPDKKLQELEKRNFWSDVYYFYLEENAGFGKGCNYGFTKAAGRYICFLNPDTILLEPIVLQIIDLFKKDQSIGIIGPRQQIRKKIFDFSAGYYPNPFFEIFNLFYLGTFLEALIVYVYTKIKKKEYYQLNWILGAAIFIKSEVFKQVGGFDKDFFMFFEEVDLCRRVSLKGFKIIYYPHLKINHIGSVSGKRDYYLFTKRIYTSKFLYISKHYNVINKLLMNSLLSAQLFSQTFLWIFLFPFNVQKSKQKIRGFINLIKNLKNIIK